MRTELEINVAIREIEILLSRKNLGQFDLGYLLGVKHALEWINQPDFMNIVDLAKPMNKNFLTPGGKHDTIDP